MIGKIMIFEWLSGLAIILSRFNGYNPAMYFLVISNVGLVFALNPLFVKQDQQPQGEK